MGHGACRGLDLSDMDVSMVSVSSVTSVAPLDEMGEEISPNSTMVREDPAKLLAEVRNQGR